MNKLIIPPDFSGYSIQDATAALYQPLDGGLGRTRADFVDGSKIANVQWTLVNKDYLYLLQFYREYIASNCQPFLINLYDETSNLIEAICLGFISFKPISSQSGIGFVIQAQLEVIPNAFVVNLSASVAPLNVGADSSVGVTLNNLNPSSTYRLSLPEGEMFSGWSAWLTDTSPGAPTFSWGNLVCVTKGPGAVAGPTDPRTSQYGSLSGFANQESARAGFSPVTITGASEYTFWLYDGNPGDDRGGLSLLVTAI